MKPTVWWGAIPLALMIVLSMPLWAKDGSAGWKHLSSKAGEIPVPTNGAQQTASVVFDIDGDGVQDIVVAERTQAPSITWLRRTKEGWSRYVIDDTKQRPEAGGTSHDVDGDGDLDLIIGGDAGSSEMWWYENPAPRFEPKVPWKRYFIKRDGGRAHHDQVVADLKGAGRPQLVFWNQGAKKLFLADIPRNPKSQDSWPYAEIWSYTDDPGGVKQEGMSVYDMDGDGKLDLLAGNHWFKHVEGNRFRPIQVAKTGGRIEAGRFDERAKAPQIVIAPGDGTGPLMFHTCKDDPAEPGSWSGRDLLGQPVVHGHTLQVMDIDRDGHLDIFTAEMAKWSNNRSEPDHPQAKSWILYGDGKGGFRTTVCTTGFGFHEGRVFDADGDGDLDIVSKPYNWETPRLDVWLQPGGRAGEGARGRELSLDRWERHVIDAEKPWRAVFIAAGDLEGDGRKDIVTGGWWYRNPGRAGGAWERRALGEPLRNMAAVHDFDGDGDPDVLGTQGQGSSASADFVWARNRGKGQFEILKNIAPADGDFLQGIEVARFRRGGPLEVALSWHQAGRGIQMLTLPSKPAEEKWSWRKISDVSQDEQISAGDMDRDGDRDLALGTRWLRNVGRSWSAHTLHPTAGDPDRNRLADLNRDGRLDVVVGFEAINVPGKLAWYEQGASATDEWTEHRIAEVVGPMSLDAADMDGDGDVDVVVGEHNMAKPETARLIVFENADGRGGDWKPHVVHTGDEHHDGTQLVDIDGDGDLDILSLGWSHGRVLLYENRAVSR